MGWTGEVPTTGKCGHCGFAPVPTTVKTQNGDPDVRATRSEGVQRAPMSGMRAAQKWTSQIRPKAAVHARSRYCDATSPNRTLATERSILGNLRSGMRTKPPFDFLPLLAQHFFAHAVVIFWSCSVFHQTSHLSGALSESEILNILQRKQSLLLIRSNTQVPIN